MTKLRGGMSRYNPDPETGFGCASCIHNSTKCTVLCKPNPSGGTGYEWNKITNHKIFWIRKTKINASEDQTCQTID